MKVQSRFGSAEPLLAFQMAGAFIFAGVRPSGGLVDSGVAGGAGGDQRCCLSGPTTGCGETVTTQQTSSAASQSHPEWTLHAWRLWPSLVARGHGQRREVGSSLRLQFGDSARDLVHCGPISALNRLRASGVELGSAILRRGQVLQEVVSHLLFKGSDFCVRHNDKHDNQIGQPCQVGHFCPENGLFMGVQ